MHKFYKLLLVSVIFFLSQNLSAQKHSVHALAGWYSSLNYERLLYEGEESLFKLYAGAQVGYQIFSFNDELERFNRVASAIYGLGLVGRNRSYFEFGLGVGPLITARKLDITQTRIVPKLSLGYRYEFEKALFRVGMGVPEIIYFGGGYRF